MLASITPVGETARGSRWSVTAVAYVTGSTVGGLATGALLGVAGALLPWTLDARMRVGAGLLALAGAAGLVADRRGLPSLRRQVNERWLTTYRGWVYGAGFGLQLGAGVATTVSASATYVVMVGALLTGSPTTAALVVGWFGLARSLPLLATGRLKTPESLRALHRWLESRTRAVVRATGTVQACVAVAASLVAMGVLT